MTILGKVRWVASILLVFLIVLFTNLIDRDNFNRLSYAVTTMYEDRIVASDLILQFSELIQDMEIALISGDSLYLQQNQAHLNRNLANLITRYEQTRLTEREALIFNQLKKDLSHLNRQQQGYLRADVPEPGPLRERIAKLRQHLGELSEIQLQEGKRQVSISQRARNAIEVFTQGEIIFLVLLSIIIQIIIFYKPQNT